MKTAKELCEEKQNEFLNEIIDNLKKFDLTLTITELTYIGNGVYDYYDKFRRLKNNEFNILDNLQRLGYSVKFGTTTYRQWDRRLKKIHIKGLSLFGYQITNDRTKEVWEYGYVEKTMEIITISACCGEANEWD